MPSLTAAHLPAEGPAGLRRLPSAREVFSAFPPRALAVAGGVAGGAGLVAAGVGVGAGVGVDLDHGEANQLDEGSAVLVEQVLDGASIEVGYAVLQQRAEHHHQLQSSSGRVSSSALTAIFCSQRPVWWMPFETMGSELGKLDASQGDGSDEKPDWVRWGAGTQIRVLQGRFARHNRTRFSHTIPTVPLPGTLALQFTIRSISMVLFHLFRACVKILYRS